MSDKKAALEDLRKRHSKAVKRVETSSEEEYTDEDDLNDFIEETEEDRAERLREERRAGPSISTFFNTSSVIHKQKRSATSSPDPEALKDGFFQNLVAQMESEEESCAIESEEVKPAVKKPARKKAKKEVKPAAEPAESDSEPEFILQDLSSAFPVPAPACELNQLEVNNAKIMEIDDIEMPSPLDVDEEFLNADDLEQLEKSFIIDNSQSQTPANELVQVKATAPVTHESIPVEEDCRLVYWFDAFERQPNGPVYLFGKMQDSSAPSGLVPCCVVVEGMQRNVFFLPREHDESGQAITFADVQAEVSELAEKYGITRFGCKRVVRKYAFELHDVPAETEYLKMVYPFNGAPQLPTGLQGRTFSHVFGTNTSALEQLLIKRKIMGPCWIKVKGATTTSKVVSWCKVELTVSSPKSIFVLEDGNGQVPPTPAMTALSISMRTIVDPSTHSQEIVAISGIVYNNVDIEGNRAAEIDQKVPSAAFTVVRDLEGAGLSARFTDSFRSRAVRVEAAKTEKALLNYFLAMLQRHDPDLLCGHNFLGFDLGVLLHRMRACRVDGWSRLGRLNWSQWPKSKGTGSNEASYAERQIVCGRVICDTYLAAKDTIRAKNYTLSTLSQSQLGLTRDDLDYDRVKDYFATPELLTTLLQGNDNDAHYIAQLMFSMNILPLTLQLTRIAGNLWSRTLTGARAERNEFLLLHEFHNLKYICPDKQAFSSSAPAFTIGVAEGDEDGKEPTTTTTTTTTATKTSGRRKPAYSGGLVLEPKKGFYDRIVLLLDFNSLYPSIIQEYNICFTSVQRAAGEEELPPVPDASLPQGVLPRILKSLVERRRAVKSLMKAAHGQSPAKLASLNIRQQALKLTANSMYGCLGFSHSRFYAKPLAMLITAKGREILQNTVNLTREVCESDVIYGDTDSIMVNTRTSDIAEARQLGAKIKKAVNERYRLLEIELDGIFQKLLLLKKKKYAALVVEEESSDGRLITKLETKGLDLVRRDWCPLSVEVSSKVLDVIMNACDGEVLIDDIHKELRDLAAQIASNSIPTEKYIISKNLTKDPQYYNDAASQPHVKVALRMRARGVTAAAGDTIPYIICRASGPSTSMADCAFHPDELKRSSELQIDTDWYLQTQIHPPVARLCEHLDGTDAAQLAQCLGLDTKKYQHSAQSNARNSSLLSQVKFVTRMPDEERFANVERLKVNCSSCSTLQEFEGIIRESENVRESGLNCSNCRNKLNLKQIFNSSVMNIFNCTRTYEELRMHCEELACGVESDRMGVYERRCLTEGCRGPMKPSVRPDYLYTQLLYLKSLFSAEKALAKLGSEVTPADTKLVQSMAEETDRIAKMIDDQLKLCQYPVVDFKEIFNF